MSTNIDTFKFQFQQQITMDFTKLSDDYNDDGSSAGENFDEEMLADEESNNDNETDSDDDDDDDDSEDDEDADDEAFIVAEINRLQDELSHNTYDYEKHVKLIEAIRLITMKNDMENDNQDAAENQFDCLRSAREKMAKIYPLSPKLWKEWINDEVAKSNTDSNIKCENIIKLYERAISDYFDFNLWSDYVNYVIENKNFIPIDKIQNVLDKALSQAGLHVNNGSSIWAAYRNFEMSKISEHVSSDNVEQQQEFYHKQLKRLYDLYCQQISIPLKGLEDVYGEFNEWLNEIEKTFGINFKEQQKNFHKFKLKYEKAMEKYKSIEKYEQNIEKGANSIENYLEYIKHLKTNYNDDLQLIQLTYERAITDNCLNERLWLDYLKYCDQKILINDILLPIYERSVRNCYWNHNLWQKYMEAIERIDIEEQKTFEQLRQQMFALFERALKNLTFDYHLELYLSYLYFLRRLIAKKIGWKNKDNLSYNDTIEEYRNFIVKTIEQFEQYKDTDYCFQLYFLQMNIEAYYLKNFADTEKIWQKFIEKSTLLKYQSNIWIDYCQLLLMDDKNIDSVRKTLWKGLNLQTNRNDLENLGEYLMKFEKLYGNEINDYDQSRMKYEKIMMKKFQNEITQQQAMIIDDFNEENLNEKATNNSNNLRKTIKRKTISANKDSNDDDDDNNSLMNKRKKLLNDKPNENNNKPKQTKTNGNVEHQNNNDKLISHGQINNENAFLNDETKCNRTIFISNLDYNIDQTKLAEIFSKFGHINDIRLITNYRGLSKGYAYIEYDNIESVQEALKNDRMLIDSRPVFINEMNKRKKFEYKQNKEDNKLFIKNIPLDITSDELIDSVFDDYRDSIRNIRLVTRRDGRSKGIAFIDVDNATIAAKIVEEKNDFILNDRKLFVAISDPTKSAKNEKMETTTSEHQQQQQQQRPQHNKPVSSSSSKSAMMIPHSLIRSKAAPSRVRLQIGNLKAAAQSSSSTTTKSEQEQSSSSSTKSADGHHLSNDQFRSLFLNNKNSN